MLAVLLLEEVATGYLSRELQVSKKEWDGIDQHKDLTPEQLRSQRLQLFGLLKSSVKKTFGGGSKKAGGDSSVSKEEEADESLELQENGGEEAVRPGFFRCISSPPAFQHLTLQTNFSYRFSWIL